MYHLISHSDQQKFQKVHYQFGPHYYQAKERKIERVIVQTCKQDCPAMTIIRGYEVFPKYALNLNCWVNAPRAEILEELRKALQEGKGNI